jgi:hypothetical protein
MPARTLLLVALVAAGLALLASTAGAQTTKTFKTKVVLTKGGPTGASGKVSCTTAGCPKACRKHRKVKLFRVQAGPDRSFGSTKTDLAGAFRINAPLIAGNYYATAAPKTLGGGDSCAAGVSIRYHF